MGGYFTGKYILDKYGYKISLKLNVILCAVTLTMALFCNNINYFTYFWFLNAFLFGFARTCHQSILLSLVGFEFNPNLGS